MEQHAQMSLERLGTESTDWHLGHDEAMTAF